MQEHQWLINVAVTLLAFGANYGALKAMFGEFKRETERRLTEIERASATHVTHEDCKHEHARNEKDHDELFGRLRPVELGLVAVKKSQLEG